MIQRALPTTVALAFLLLALPVCPANQTKTNVLFIAVDDLACTLGCYGDLIAKTPNIDRLAAQGITFMRAYNQLPLCNPTRASVMTGLRPDTIGVYDLDRHFRDEIPDAVTLPQAFLKAGYRTARVGKIYHYNVPASIGTDGHDDPPSWQETINPKGRDKDEEDLIFNAEPHRKISAALSWLAADGEDTEQTDGKIASSAIRWMEENQDQPFFLGVGFFRPHTPYVAPKEYFELYPRKTLALPFAPTGDRQDIPIAAFAHNCPVPNYGLSEDALLGATQAYYACVSFIDAQVGRLLDTLDELGLADRTMVVFWSDHGYHLGDHNGIWQKRTLFEQSSRSPLIIRTPKHLQSGSLGPCRRVVEFVDIYPTVTDGCGLVAPNNLEGRSLKSLLNNPQADWEEEAITQVVRPADSRLPKPVMGRSIRTHRYRYTEWDEGRMGRELYDHHADPNEFNNLAQQLDPNLKALMKQLSRRLDRKALGTVPDVPINPARL
ncbi:MAG: sulfatase [Planctomycetota bacterium]